MPEQTPFTSLLIANRGEIALRIMRSARAQGLTCIAVYTEADADAPHVGFADQAVCIGPGPAHDSYLSIERLLDAARQAGAGAIHPGYGFLSENAGFAQACADAGLVFVGPPPGAIASMGDKAEAKALMQQAGVPCVPGYQGADQSDDAMHAAAGDIGYPVMIKAAAGGGGRGMRLVTEPGGFLAALHLARAEAASGFGCDRIILEKALMDVRHVEVQVFADRHGNVVHLGERDCSVQRRHQKLIEESPCPVMTPDLRARMGAAAIDAARAVGYEGAGTVEFLLQNSGAFYFLEMNTRLQVEHPVTEQVTGRDLVALQLAVAQGLPLGFDQPDVTLSGHAIEVRLYAEDPANGFLPATGDIARWTLPKGPGIRVDSGIATGQTISSHYDPMLAKIIAHGDSRQQARQRLIAALQDCVLFGLPSNRDFLAGILAHPSFAAGEATTRFIAEMLNPDQGAQGLPPDLIALAAALTYRALQARAVAASEGVSAELLDWGSPGYLTSMLQLSEGGNTHAVTLRATGDGALCVQLGDDSFAITGQGRQTRINGVRADLRDWIYDGAQIHVATGARSYALAHHRATAHGVEQAGGGSLFAPMHGQLLDLCVAPGDVVRPGTRLAVLEAMKMQHELLSETAGTVLAVPAKPGTQVQAGTLLVEIAVEDTQ